MELFPNARDIVALTDILHPSYMTELVREDGWGNPIVYEVTGDATFRLAFSRRRWPSRNG